MSSYIALHLSMCVLMVHGCMSVHMSEVCMHVSICVWVCLSMFTWKPEVELERLLLSLSTLVF